MGLDTTHDCWHGAYSAFSRWRNMLAEAAGYALAKIDDGPVEDYLIDWGHISQSNLEGEWDQTPADPLLVLLAHSDCDGWINPEQAGPLADRLDELALLLPEEGAGHLYRPREQTQRFARGLRDAVAAGERVEFW